MLNINLDKIQKIIGYKFKDEKLINKAFIHRSFVNENRDEKLKHNERLEFLGDAVLELVVTEYLFINYPKEPEGILTNWRSALVKTESLSEVAKKLEVNDFLQLSHGEEKSGGTKRKSLQANLVEAIIGAIYLDGGYDDAVKFIDTTILSKLESIIENKEYIDSKSHFQEMVQEKLGITPHYKVVDSDGPDHDKHFTIAVYVADKNYGKGKGKSKQLAQQAAATEGLKLLVEQKIIKDVR